MKQCISRVKLIFIHLWQTLKMYVCKKKKKHIYLKDVDNDSIPEVVLDLNGLKEEDESKSHIEINDKEVNKYD